MDNEVSEESNSWIGSRTVQRNYPVGVQGTRSGNNKRACVERSYSPDGKCTANNKCEQVGTIDERK